MNNLFRGISFSQEDKIHEHIKEALLLEGEQREILLAVFTRFCRFSKGAFCSKSPTSTGRNDRLKPGPIITLFGISGIEQDSFQRHCFDIQGLGFFKTPGVFIDSPGSNK